MSKLKDYAFPTDNSNQSGLTKREYFAALAMQGILACPTQYAGSCSENALKYADALIKALNKEENNE